MSSSQKVVVVESEKSPKICSTNWKEDLILKRNLQVLDRSQHTVVNRITVDQKILFRRFQTKLGRSKMSYARTMGNMELQKKLRDKTTFVLNTNVGHNDEQEDSLSRLWNNGQKTYRERVSGDTFLQKKKIGAFTCIEDDEAPVSTATKKDSVGDRPLTAVNLRPDTAVTIARPIVQTRPVTSVDARTKQMPGDTSHADKFPNIIVTAPGEHICPHVRENEVAVQSGTSDSVEDIPKPHDKKPRPQTAKASVQEKRHFETAKNAKKRRPSTAGGYLHSPTKEVLKSPKTTRTKTSPRPNKSPVKTYTPNAGIGSMFKSDEFEISLLDFQRFRVYSANYEKRVKRYGDRIKELTADRTHSVDYYTSKLQDSMQKAKKKLQMEAAAEATPEDIKRATGNLSIRSLTLKTVDEKDKNKQSPPLDIRAY